MRESLALRYAIVCFATHALFITASLIPDWRETALLRGDAMTYVNPAENLIEHGVFSREDHPPYLWEPYRTPGYPMLIAASILLFDGVQWTLYVAAFTAGLAGWSVIRLTQMWGGHLTAQHWAGVLLALLPNSLGLSARLLTDATFGHLVVVWLYAFITVLRKGSVAAFAASVFLLVFLQTVKPTFLVALVIVAGVAFLFARGTRSWVLTGILIVCSLPTPTYFAVRNLEDHGVFSPTLLGVETVRQYLQVRQMQAITGRDFATLKAQMRRADLVAAQALATPNSSYGRLYAVQKSEVVCFLRMYPVQAVGLMLTEMGRQFLAPQDIAFKVFWAPFPPWGRGMGVLMTLALWGGSLWGCILLRRNGNGKICALILGILLFFLVTGSLSHYVGARLRFPADLAVLPVASIGLSSLFARRATLTGTQP